MSENRAPDPSQPLSPSQVFARQMQAARKTAGLTLADLQRRLATIGYSVSGSTLNDIETGKRKAVTIDEALVIAWAIGVAPLNLLVPFEEPEPVTVNDDGEPIPPVWRSLFELEVARGIQMPSAEARAWISGVSIRDDGTDHGVTRRLFYVDFVPPRQQQEAIEAGRKLAEDAAKAERRISAFARMSPELLDDALLAQRRKTVADATEGNVAGHAAQKRKPRRKRKE